MRQVSQDDGALLVELGVRQIVAQARLHLGGDGHAGRGGPGLAGVGSAGAGPGAGAGGGAGAGPRPTGSGPGITGTRFSPLLVRSVVRQGGGVVRQG